VRASPQRAKFHYNILKQAKAPKTSIWSLLSEVMAPFFMRHRCSRSELCHPCLVSQWGRSVFSFHSVSPLAPPYSYRQVTGRFHTDVDDFSKALESVFQGKATVLYRMRLSCAFSDKDGNSIGKEGKGIRIHAAYPTQ
jgi:hypothetical protein